MSKLTEALKEAMENCSRTAMACDEAALKFSIASRKWKADELKFKKMYKEELDRINENKA